MIIQLAMDTAKYLDTGKDSLYLENLPVDTAIAIKAFVDDMKL